MGCGHGRESRPATSPGRRVAPSDSDHFPPFAEREKYFQVPYFGGSDRDALLSTMSYYQ